jgi:hypothetical protein
VRGACGAFGVAVTNNKKKERIKKLMAINFAYGDRREYYPTRK